MEDNCPYCGAEVEICHDDGYGLREDRLHEQHCHECGQTFVYETYISVTHELFKADCLNGAKHKWEPVVHAPQHYPNWKRCCDCGKEDRGKRVEAAQAE